jgi:hypothetical protein
MSMSNITTFTIDGKKIDNLDDFLIFGDEGCSLLDFSLEETFLQPAEFTFTLRRNTFDKGKTNALNMIDNVIGKEVFCEVETKLNTTTNSKFSFRGKIAKVSIKGMNLTCIAYSPDAELQGSPKCRCFTNKKIKDIIDEVIPASMLRYIELFTCIEDFTFPYIVQYNESDYDFLVKLAKRFGAFFYFNCQLNRLVFGKLPIAIVKEIQSPNVASISYELQTEDANFKYAMHYYEKSVDLRSQGATFSILCSKQLSKTVVDASTDRDRSYSFYIDNPYSLPKDPSGDLIDDYNAMVLASNSGRMVMCKFTCFLFDVQLGDIVHINNNGNMVVTSANLTWDCNGSPQNEITAMVLHDDRVNLEDVFAPYMDINAYPKSSAQRAVVFNNVDPKKMGRVQVQFVWQKAPATDQEKADIPWIRIAQPYGGDQKGCYILPEIGEEVMVGFEHENMEKPFVIGTLFHNSDKDEEKQMPDESWVEAGDDNKENEVKAFRTKKGHTIEFHDTKEGDGFIRVYGYEKKEQGHEQDPPKPNYDIILSTDEYKDSSTNQYYKAKSADEGAKTGCDIKVKEDYEVKKLRIKVQSYGGDIMLDAGSGDIVLNAANIRVNATGNTTTHIGGKNIVKVDDAQLIDVGSHSFVVQKDQRILVTGEDKENYKEKANIVFSKDLAVTSDSLQMKTHHKTEVKAMDVELITDKSTKVKANTGLELDGGAKSNMKGGSVTIQGTTAAIVKSAKLTLGDDVGLTTIQGTTIELSPEISGIRKGTWTDM